MLMPLTVPLRLVDAVAVDTLKELLRLDVAVAPLLAAAEPAADALAAPELLRLAPVLLSLLRSDWFLLSELLLLSDWFLLSAWFLLSELLLLSDWLLLSLFCVAVENSFAFGPAPVCVEVAVAV